MTQRTNNAIITNEAAKDSDFRMSGFKIKLMQIKMLFLPVFFDFFKINAKSLIFLVFAILFAIISAITVFWSFKQIEYAAIARQQSQLIIHEVNLLTSTIKDAETSVHGYLLTDNVAFLQPYSTDISRIHLQLEQLQQLNLSMLGHQYLNTLLPLIEAKLTHMERLVMLQRNNNQAEAITLVKRAEGLQLMEAIRLEMRQFITSQEASLTQNEAMFQSTMQRFFYIIAIGSIFTLLFALIFAYFFHREVKQKIKNIVHAKTQHLLETQETISYKLQQANNILESSEEKLAVTLNSIGDAVIATDIFGRVTRLNKVAETLTGWSLNEAIARPMDEIFNIINAQSREPVASPIFEAITEAQVQYLPKNTLLISRNGNEYNIADTCAPIFNVENVVQGAVLVFRDVTEYEAVQTKLRASEELYRDTFEHASIGIAHVDINGHFIRTNHCFSVIAGYSVAELLNLKFQDITHPEDLDKDVALFERMLTGEIDHYSMEKRYVRKDQSSIWIELSVSCVRHLNGEINYFIGVVENITKRIQAAADSRRFFNLSQELLCIANFEGFFIEVNDVWEEIFGYTRQEMLENSYIEFVHKDDREYTMREMANLMQGGTLPNFENRYICKDGSIRHILWNITADNVTKQLYCSARDMTMHKQHEDNLLLRTNQFETLLDASPVGIYLVNKDFKIKHYNQLASHKFSQIDNLYNVDLKDLLFETLQETNAKTILKQFRKTLKTGLPYYQSEFFDQSESSAKASYCTWHINRIGLPNGELGVVCYFQDVTKNVLNQQKIIESEKQFRTLFNLGPVAMYFCDVDGKIQQYNQCAVEIWQSEPKRNQSYEDFRNKFKYYELDGTEIHTSKNRIFNVLNGSLASVHDKEITLERPDGTRVNLIINIVPIKDDDNKIIGAMNSFFDVTFRKQTEDALFNYALEVEEARAVAEKANAAKSEFLSNMSHELRTPLNAILGFAQLIESGNPPPAPSQQRSIKQILQGGWYLLELINEILDLAQIESGKQPLSLEPVLLNDIMRECAMLIEPLAIKNAISVTFSSIEPNTYVLSDKTRLKQVLINLLSNAIKYNKKDGLVSVNCSHKNDIIKISVRDTGIGLNAVQLSHLFEPFNRLGQHAHVEEGTGIGLMVSKKLVELMQGNIGVRSKVNQGSVFWITLNLVKSPALLNEYAQLPALNNKPVLNNKEVQALQTNSQVKGEPQANLSLDKLLYIEDNQANFSLVQEMIARNANISLQGATNGAQGLKMASAWLPHVILLDINLPDMSGFAVLQALAKNAATTHIPVIAISANAMRADIQKGIEAGFFRYLTKPIQLNELMDALEFAFKYTKMTKINMQ